MITSDKHCMGDKHCTGCDRDLPESEFNWKNKALGRRQSRCRECMKKSCTDWYVLNKADHVANVSARNRVQIAKLKEAAQQRRVSCDTCGCQDQANLCLVDARDPFGPAAVRIADAQRKALSEATFTALLDQTRTLCRSCLGKLSGAAGAGARRSRQTMGSE